MVESVIYILIWLFTPGAPTRWDILTVIKSGPEYTLVTVGICSEYLVTCQGYGTVCLLGFRSSLSICLQNSQNIRSQNGPCPIWTHPFRYHSSEIIQELSITGTYPGSSITSLVLPVSSEYASIKRSVSVNLLLFVCFQYTQYPVFKLTITHKLAWG